MENEKLQLVTFEQAKKLEEIGFDWNVERFYSSEYGHLASNEDNLFSDNFNLHQSCLDFLIPNLEGEVISAPSIALALKWFNDVKKITSGIGGVIGADKPLPHPYYWTEYYWAKYWICGDETVLKYFQTRDMAEEALLDELLNIL
jgi:hypothetical protein